MGHTNYYKPSRAFTENEWASICKYSKQIIKKATAQGIEICGGDGTGKPQITKDLIVLNGTDVDDQGHETFALTRVPADSFNFCKTAQKPYDVVVTSILYAAKRVAPDALEISSDGGPEVFKDDFGVIEKKAKKSTREKDLSEAAIDLYCIVKERQKFLLGKIYRSGDEDEELEKINKAITKTESKYFEVAK